MLLSDIVTGKRKSPFILIIDSAEQGGIKLMHAIIQSCADRGCEVHVACFERPVSAYKHLLRETEKTVLCYHDFFTDHLGWLGKATARDINEKLGSIEYNASGNSVLVIDSIVSLVMESSSAVMYKFLHRLLSSQKTAGTMVQQIVGLLHKDMMEDIELAEISHLAYTTLEILPSKQKSHGRPLCSIKHRTSKGKINREVEHFSVDSCNRLWSETYKEITSAQVVEPVDPMADVTTFKLSLGEEEKKARSELILPYLRKESTGDNPGSGVIHYVPDEYDDWDEEDPDNDLNI